VKGDGRVAISDPDEVPKKIINSPHLQIDGHSAHLIRDGLIVRF